MLIQGHHSRTIHCSTWPIGPVLVLDQRDLPHQVHWLEVQDAPTMRVAIKEMAVRGAPLIGVSAAWGLALAVRDYGIKNPDQKSFDPSAFLNFIQNEAALFLATRPTAVNLRWAIERLIKLIQQTLSEQPKEIQRDQSLLQNLQIQVGQEAERIANEDVDSCQKIGQNGLVLLYEILANKMGIDLHSPEFVNMISQKSFPTGLNILTHCNAGWLACVDYGTATAPIYAAVQAGISVHVYVDETRPRNQGAKLTAWELGEQGVSHSLIVDNAGGHLMQHGLIDVVIVGADRVGSRGDAANKIGTYLKALAAHDNKIPFLVAFPMSTLDWNIQDGVAEIPIEERDELEVLTLDGLRIAPLGTKAKNPGFDVTPARLITGLITERGVCTPANLWKWNESGNGSESQAETSDLSRKPLVANSIDGVVKFKCQWNQQEWGRAEQNDAHRDMVWDLLKLGRNSLVQAKLLGIGDDGVGFGNLSIRDPWTKGYFITGTQTGMFYDLDLNGYARVEQWDVKKNTIQCKGPVSASSESLTHGVLYSLSSQIGSVAHGHHPVLWNRLQQLGAPSTSPQVLYGTPQMAEEVERIWKSIGSPTSGFLVMGGHENGVLSWGADPIDATERLVSLLRGFGLLPRGMGEQLTTRELEEGF